MSFPETKFGQVLEVLSGGEIRCIVVGGLAAMAHGNARSTYDVDLVYSRDRENIRRLVQVIGLYQPYAEHRRAYRSNGTRRRSRWG